MSDQVLLDSRHARGDAEEGGPEAEQAGTDMYRPATKQSALRKNMSTGEYHSQVSQALVNEPE